MDPYKTESILNTYDLFSKTAELDKFASKSTNGAGLGLYLSRKIVEAHGGKIWIERIIDKNEDEDERGALFAFSLPIKKQSRQQ